MFTSRALQSEAAFLHRNNLVAELVKLRPELELILARPIKDIGLKIEGSPLERFVKQLYRELESKKLNKFHPVCYLSDEWGCPSGEPVIGIPFYLADAELSRLEQELNDLEDAREIMMFLRHEAGHAFNYAYRLYRTPEWKQIFGSFRRPYHDDYRPIPFSKNYVRHMAGWYAQKHPDEDFAETFAVWLTPRSAWRTKYRGWGALAKLKYMDRIARQLSNVEPVRKRGETDITVEEMETTVGEFYRRTEEQIPLVDLALDADLAAIFNASKKRKNTKPAHAFLWEHRKRITDDIAYWTGVRRPLIKRLLEVIGKRSEDLGLRVDGDGKGYYLTNITSYTTALAMTYMARGRFVHSEIAGDARNKWQTN